jgi:hypothetical protein
MRRRLLLEKIIGGMIFVGGVETSCSWTRTRPSVSAMMVVSNRPRGNRRCSIRCLARGLLGKGRTLAAAVGRASPSCR